MFVISNEVPSWFHRVGLWWTAVAVFPLTYVTTIPFFLKFHKYNQKVTDNKVLADVNLTFVQNYGYLWFTIIYFGYLFTYHTNGKLPTRQTIQFILHYVVNSVVCLAINIWFFGPLIFERLNYDTGGHCSTTGLSYKQCRDSKGTWIGGFDASGHYYLITSISLMVISVFLRTDNQHKLRQQSEISLPQQQLPSDSDNTLSIKMLFGARSSQIARIYFIILKISTIGVLIMWYWMYLVTSIFFHTITEKLVGLIIGLIVPVVLHRSCGQSSL